MANNNRKSYYTNPAFTQQSEFYNGVPLNQIILQNRQSPVGAQTPFHYYEPSPANHNNQYEEEDDDEEQEFYEEMLVDDAGMIKEKKVLVVSSSQSRETSPSTRGAVNSKTRYEYIPMKEHHGTNRYQSPQQHHHNQQKTPTKKIQMQHRYALIETTNNEDFVPPHHQNHRYEYIQEDPSPKKTQNNRYEYVKYQQAPAPGTVIRNQNYVPNPLATQKLHELLSTPKKSPCSKAAPVKSPRSQTRSTDNNPFVTPNKKSSPHQKVAYAQKSRQKLNYTLGTRQQVAAEKRHTAIVAPRCSSPIQSIYSETTFSRTESWMNVHHPKKPTQMTLAVAAFMMMLCGGVTSALCFYMVSIMGRLYFLDFGIIAGFTCLVLGLLGFRTRNCYWLPNRNYISGYIVLSVFSLLMCVGLLVLLVMQPKPGTPLADMTSGAVCGISVLSLVLACVGVVTSYCCKYPPPDNRVQHSVSGFVV